MVYQVVVIISDTAASAGHTDSSDSIFKAAGGQPLPPMRIGPPRTGDKPQYPNHPDPSLQRTRRRSDDSPSHLLVIDHVVVQILWHIRIMLTRVTCLFLLSDTAASEFDFSLH